MREVEFRGKSLVTNNWVYGNYIIDKWGDDNNEIIYGILRDRTAPSSLQNWIPVRVDRETIGQFTGIKDKNGIKIYEGDIVKFNNQTGEIVFEYGSFGVGIEEGIDYERLEDFTRENLDNSFDGTFNDNFLPLFEIYYNLNNIDGYIDEVEVIGNIYDNPELLEVSDD